MKGDISKMLVSLCMWVIFVQVAEHLPADYLLDYLLDYSLLGTYVRTLYLGLPGTWAQAKTTSFSLEKDFISLHPPPLLPSPINNRTFSLSESQGQQGTSSYAIIDGLVNCYNVLSIGKTIYWIIGKLRVPLKYRMIELQCNFTTSFQCKQLIMILFT